MIAGVDLHIIYNQSAMILSKKRYASWREVQKEYPNSEADLGPWPTAVVIDYLRDEYPDLEPDAATQVDAFLRSDEETRLLTFRG